MSLEFRILGGPDWDNALYVQVDSGQSVERLLFDCGDACLAGFTPAEIQEIDHLFFSHLHMDHVCGFDSFFRCNFNRLTKPNRVWGPPGTAAILHHRFQGFVWNLHETMEASWRVHDIHPDHVQTWRSEVREAFATLYDDGPLLTPGLIHTGAGLTVEALAMDHKIPSMAYVVREKVRRNIDMAALEASGLRPGAWMRELKEVSEECEIDVHGQTFSASALQRDLLVETPGDSIAYLTDFLLDDAARERLVPFLKDCRVVVCEGQYRHADLELARRHHHMTTVQVAGLAAEAGVEELWLFHLSERYAVEEWKEMLREARAIFPAARYAAHWALE